MKKNVLVFFGGRSCEHDISIITAHQAMPFIDPERYNIFPVYIDINGQFLHGESLKEFEFCKDIDYSKLKKIYFMPASQNVYCKKNKILCKADVALLCMHGLNGEDGTLQGMLEMSGIPYTSSGVLGSAVGMDKICMKMFFSGLGLKVVPYVWFTKEEYQQPDKKEEIIDRAEMLKYPLMVKPSNLGSSIGITRVGNRSGLLTAIEVALKFDNRVIIERAIKEMIEINCSVLGSALGAKASECERPLNWQEFLTFEDKYMGGKKTGGMNTLKRRLPADIPEEKSAQIKEQSLKVFRALDCKGVVRIDYIIDTAADEIYINEINSIPGSLAYYLWEYENIKFSYLIENLIEAAIYESSAKRRLKYAYRSDVLRGSGGAKV